jgi:Fe-S-cluster-containing dehydrogenase component
MGQAMRRILVREDVCSGCSVCVDACPFGVATLHPETGLALICDLCGGDPAYVKRGATVGKLTDSRVLRAAGEFAFSVVFC